jgi:hypothetical protein
VPRGQSYAFLSHVWSESQRKKSAFPHGNRAIQPNGPGQTPVDPSTIEYEIEYGVPRVVLWYQVLARGSWAIVFRKGWYSCERKDESLYWLAPLFAAHT